MQAAFLSIFLWLATAFAASALPFQDRVLTVDTREFFIGTPNRPVVAQIRDWPMDYADWLRDFVEIDPVLSGYRIFFHQTGFPAIELVNRRREGFIETDTELQIPGFETYNNSGALTFFPLDDGLEYSVWCTGNANSDFGFRVCNIRVVYPFGTNVSLIAKRFFPGKLSEIGHTFDDIAHRMIEVAICLDVTDMPKEDRPLNSEEILAENPSLNDCEIDLIS